MRKKIQYLVIHTSDTPYDREVTPDDITLWHLGACKQSNGTYKFLGKTYTLSELKKQYLTLPSGKKINAASTNGRGWTVVGYSDMINRKGELINLNPYTFDDTNDQWEITNGVAGKNSICRNIVLIGGWSKDGKIKNGHIDGDLKKPYMKISNLYTKEQIKALVDYVNMYLEILPELKIVGHNDLSTKTCPNFLVSEFLKEYKIYD